MTAVTPLSMSPRGQASPAPTAVPFLFTHGTSVLCARGVREIVAQPVDAGLAGAAAAATARAGVGALVVGALPFDRRQAAHLVVPDVVDRLDAIPAGASAPAPQVVSLVEQPSRRDFEAAVARALERIAERGTPLQKVVLARTQEVRCAAPIDPVALAARLAAGADISTFCVPLPARADGSPRTLVGATPELLVERRGRTVASLPMAGSAQRQDDAAADRAVSQALIASAKDQREHRTVVEAILDTLAPHCAELRAPDVPVLAATSTMWHLATPIEGTLRRDLSSLELAVALHPTPAVCGTPREAARDLIAELEPFERGFYAGAVGWCDAAGDGRWMVAIRCAELAGATARLFAGAGIVAGSEPAAEADETAAKFGTIRRAFGLDHGDLDAGPGAGAA